MQVQVLSPAPYRVFITDLSYEHSIFIIRFRKRPVALENSFDLLYNIVKKIIL